MKAAGKRLGAAGRRCECGQQRGTAAAAAAAAAAAGRTLSPSMLD
jgi:hypothetical protein